MQLFQVHSLPINFPWGNVLWFSHPQWVDIRVSQTVKIVQHQKRIFEICYWIKRLWVFLSSCHFPLPLKLPLVGAQKKKKSLKFSKLEDNTHLLHKGSNIVLLTFGYIRLVCLWWINNRFSGIVKSKTVKQEISWTVILSLLKKVSVFWNCDHFKLLQKISLKQKRVHTDWVNF